jgi:hypothetical protein
VPNGVHNFSHPPPQILNKGNVDSNSNNNNNNNNNNKYTEVSDKNMEENYKQAQENI